jgi:hypothetical protein
LSARGRRQLQPPAHLGLLRFQAPGGHHPGGTDAHPVFHVFGLPEPELRQPWVRPPVEVYSLNPFADLNGIDALYRTPIGATDLELHLFGGKSTLDVRHGSAKLQAIRGLKAALSVSGLTLQAGYARSNLSVYWGDPLFSMLNAQLLATGNAHIAQDLSGNDSKASFLSAGFQYDSDRVLLIGEYARRTVDRYTVSSAGWYLTSGYRFGPLTLTSPLPGSRKPPRSPQHAAGLHRSMIHRPLQCPRNKPQRSTADWRAWDAARNIAIKTQLERSSPAPRGWGYS